MGPESELSGIRGEGIVSDSAPIKECTKEYKWNIVWRNIFSFLYIHYACIYGLLHITMVYKLTFFWFVAVGIFCGLGVTAGAHRLWAHRTYKAKWPLRLVLMILQTAAFQDDIYNWVRDHRMHHKFTDTDADPYNASRGFFFSHMGWLLVRKHPDVVEKGATVDCSDLKEDRFVVFQRKYYLYLVTLLSLVTPTVVPWLAWNESLWYSWNGNMAKYCITLHITWLVNSAAHMWGMKPYEKSITSTENAVVAFLAFGEGWHNYHHVFPWDYKTGELGSYKFNLTKTVIDALAYLGLAYDLKTVSPDMVKKRVLRNSKTTADKYIDEYTKGIYIEHKT